MTAFVEMLALALVGAFFFGFGWYGAQVAQLWGTPKYGGPAYVCAFLKGIACGAFLFAGLFVADYWGVPDARREAGVLIGASLVLPGWLMSARHRNRRDDAAA